MRPELPPREAFESALDESLPPAQRERRRDTRYVFYSMIVDMLESGPITWRQQRRLMRYAVQVGLDRFEARLLMTGAQFRCGHLQSSRWQEHWMGNGPSHLDPRRIGLDLRDLPVWPVLVLAAIALLSGMLRLLA